MRVPARLAPYVEQIADNIGEFYPGGKWPMSIGDDRVRRSFNPSANDQVDEIKAQTAALIDLCDSINGDPRLKALAMTAYEEAAMWAVKAATA